MEPDFLDARMRQLEEEIERAYFKLTGLSFWGLPNGPGEDAAAACEKLRRADPAQRATVAALLDELAEVRKGYCGLVDLDVVLEATRVRTGSKMPSERASRLDARGSAAAVIPVTALRRPFEISREETVQRLVCGRPFPSYAGALA